MTAAIVVERVSKRYTVRDGDRPTKLKTLLTSRRKTAPTQYRWGLRDVSFRVPRGGAVGVVGLNGAGKSTLLRLIGGIGRPDEGSITVNGRIGALLDIGAGLTEDMSGRENVFLLGVIAGMRRSEVRERFDAIVAFAELDHAIDQPIRTYSTGMKMRLAFAVAAHGRPDLLLIDEALAVGDLAFQQKCLRRVQASREEGTTIFLVAHDLAQIESVCEQAILLSEGHLVAYGPLEETFALYRASIDRKILQQQSEPASFGVPAGSDLVAQVNRFGSGNMQIAAVSLRSLAGGSPFTITSGDAVVVTITCRRLAEVAADPIVLFAIYTPDATCLYEVNRVAAGIRLQGNGDDYHVALEIDRLDLAPGRYFITVGLFSENWQVLYDYHAEAYPLDVAGVPLDKGFLNPPMRWHQDQRASREPSAISVNGAGPPQ